MKRTGKCLLSMLLAGSMTLGSASASITTAKVYAGTAKNAQKKETQKGKYISDVYIAYGKTESDAVKWLTDNGWDPIAGNRDFNAGKNSSDNKSVAAVMGIRRTDKVKEAITDMAVMNMQGGYSFPGYEEILDDKRSEIDDFIYSFLPALEEYRDNFNGGGSGFGKIRAQLAYELLNRFYDGDPEDKYAVNDTGLLLGDLLLEPLIQEGAGEGSGDLEQIILEGAKPSVSAVENVLALAADTGKNSWIDRLEYLTWDELTDNLENYIPETAGQDVAPSAVMQYYMLDYGDAAELLSDKWDDVHETMKWYEEFSKSHGFGSYNAENEKENSETCAEAIEELKAEEKGNLGEDAEELDRYTKCTALYNGLYSINYQGEWGNTLGDFFNPVADSSYSTDLEFFLPMAVALSEGQKSSLSFISLENLLMMGFLNEDGIKELFADIIADLDEMIGESEAVSVYSGINRGIFRDGVALTSKTLMEISKGENLTEFIEEEGMSDSLSVGERVICCVIGAAIVAAGLGLAGRGINLGVNSGYFRYRIQAIKKYWQTRSLPEGSLSRRGYEDVRGIAEGLNDEKEIRLKLGSGVVFACIGICLIVGTIIHKAKVAHEACIAYHNKDFTRIPTMIVDEKDIVTYVEVDGEMKRNIDLDQHAYYEAVRCNRQEVGELGKWQQGVSDYEKAGCGDIADLNADQGLEWLALYTARAYVKGDQPILADSLKLAFGEENKPDLDTPTLHYFCNLGRADLADRAYCYSNNKGKMYFSWQIEKAA